MGIHMNKYTWLYRLILGALGITTVMSVTITALLEASRVNTPQAVEALGVAAIDGMAEFPIPIHLTQ